MSAHAFDESKVRREQGKFAVKPRSEAEVDLSWPEPVESGVRKPVSVSESVLAQSAERVAQSQFDHAVGDRIAYTASLAPEGAAGIRAYYPNASSGEAFLYQGASTTIPGEDYAVCWYDAQGRDLDMDDDEGGVAAVDVFSPAGERMDAFIESKGLLPEDNRECRDFGFDSYVGQANRRHRDDELVSALKANAFHLKNQGDYLEAQRRLDDSNTWAGQYHSVILEADGLVYAETPDADYVDVDSSLEGAFDSLRDPESTVVVDVDALRSWRPGESTDWIVR